MYNHDVHRQIYTIDQLMTYIREVEGELQLTNDPSLREDLLDERFELIEEFKEVCAECVELIEEYVKECKEDDTPVSLDYYRVLKELKAARY